MVLCEEEGNSQAVVLTDLLEGRCEGMWVGVCVGGGGRGRGKLGVTLCEPPQKHRDRELCFRSRAGP